MIFDCFLFNNEIELLQLRLKFLNRFVDKFVILESTRSLSGNQKPLYFLQNKHLFQEYNHQIIHVIVPANDLPAWEYEFFQRNYIKEALKQCQDDDLIMISDVDEIVNLPEVLPLIIPQKTNLIELPMYYYWFNLKTNHSYWVNVIGPWQEIKTKDIGERFDSYQNMFPNKIYANQVNTGWHFSYLFGTDIKCYQNKINSFSHQEYATDYFLNERRILKCVNLGVDLFERTFMKFSYTSKNLHPILPAIKDLALDKYLFEPSAHIYFRLDVLSFLIRKIYLKKTVAFCLYPFTLIKKILTRLSIAKYF